MKRRLAVWLCVLLVFGLSGVGIRELLPREPLLLERAARVADTADWNHGTRWNSSIRVHWLSDHELLYNRYRGNQYKDRVVYRRDLLTGVETELPHLTKARDILGGESSDANSVSPDGKWLVCSARWGKCLLAEVEGNRHFLYPSVEAGYRGIYWLPDSRYWLEEYRDRRTVHCLLLHDVQHPGVAKKLPTGDGRPERYLSLGRAVFIEWPEEEMDDAGNLILDANAKNRSKQIAVTIKTLHTNAKPSARYTLSLPAVTKQFYFKISPQITKAAWLVNSQTEAPLQAWLHRLLPSVKSTLRQTTALWVSNLDGSGRHEVGRIVETRTEPSDDAPDDDRPLIEDLKWLPGGNRLSFEYKDRLYTVPAD